MKPVNPYPLRIDEELMNELKKIAQYNSRSVNKEIEYIIKKRIEEFKEIQEKKKAIVTPQ